VEQSKLDELKKNFGSIAWDDPARSYTVPKQDIVKIAKFLKDTGDFLFEYLKCLTAVDYTDRMEVVYELYSFRLNVGMKLKVILAPSDLKISSVTSVWGAADWFEREVYDMFGIVFEGHPNLKRILLEDDWKGFPLRKNYTDEMIVRKPVS